MREYGSAAVAALRLQLRALQQTVFPQDPMLAIHAALHRALEGVDASLSRRVHDETIKSFALSPLHRMHASAPHPWTFAAGESIWLRVTTLEQDILGCLLAALSRHWRELRPLTLESSPFLVEALTPIALMPVAGTPLVPYSDLLSEAEPADEIALRFVSPVTIRNRGDVLLPTDPWRVFGSYLRRWEAFSDVSLPGVDEVTVRSSVTFLPIRPLVPATRALGFNAQRGYLGTVRFRVGGDPAFQRSLAALATYAAYCGTGSRTAFGMGQTERVMGR